MVMRTAVYTTARLCLVALLGSCGMRNNGPTPHPHAVRILPLGDSITQGNRKFDSYRRPLWQMLTNAGYRVDFVGSTRSNHWGPPPHPDFDLDHDGHWGWRADEVLERLPQWLTRTQRPDVVLIHLGSNDLFQGQPMADTVEEIRAIVRLLREANPKIRVLVAELIPAAGGEEVIGAFNHMLVQLVAESTESSPVTIVDQYTGFDPGKLTHDGVHPNEAGEEVMAERWFEALQPILDH